MAGESKPPPAGTFARLLWNWRHRRKGKTYVGHLSQAEAATKLGVPLHTFIKWERNLAKPREIVRQALEKRLKA
ncbi:MAG: hypothetical protein JO317_03510 [Verrucomicrobiae bacterium]|nr:hypothetical protein [Verrucomicrobiae bacterium]